jgi:hypothetical protein
MSRAAGEEPVSDHWSVFATRWRHFGPPLSPSPEDLAFFRSSLEALPGANGRRARCALLLGVTPAYARFSWPADTTLIALDQNPDMIRHVWPGSGAAHERVVCGDWMQPPLSPGSADVVVGDGVLITLPFPHGYGRLGAALAAVAAPGALCSLRMFCLPERSESPGRVVDDALGGAIDSFHAFKLRLVMALHGQDEDRGVSLADVWNFWNELGAATHRAVKEVWPAEVVDMIDAYRGARARYSFARPDSVAAVLRSYAVLQRVDTPTYELGERCPTLAFRFS